MNDRDFTLGVVFQRMGWIFVSPRRVFEALKVHVETADWVYPFLVLTVMGLLAVQMVLGMSVPPEAQLEPEQLISAEYAILWGLGNLGFLLLFGGLYWGLARFILGGEVTFFRVLAVVSYSDLIAVLDVVLAVPLTLSWGLEDGALSLNLILPASSEALTEMFAQVTPFLVWKQILIGIGLGVVSGISEKKSVCAVVVFWVIYTLGMILA